MDMSIGIGIGIGIGRGRSVRLQHPSLFQRTVVAVCDADRRQPAAGPRCQGQAGVAAEQDLAVECDVVGDLPGRYRAAGQCHGSRAGVGGEAEGGVGGAAQEAVVLVGPLLGVGRRARCEPDARARRDPPSAHVQAAPGGQAAQGAVDGFDGGAEGGGGVCAGASRVWGVRDRRGPGGAGTGDTVVIGPAPDRQGGDEQREGGESDADGHGLLVARVHRT